MSVLGAARAQMFVLWADMKEKLTQNKWYERFITESCHVTKRTNSGAALVAQVPRAHKMLVLNSMQHHSTHHHCSRGATGTATSSSQLPVPSHTSQKRGQDSSWSHWLPQQLHATSSVWARKDFPLLSCNICIIYIMLFFFCQVGTCRRWIKLWTSLAKINQTVIKGNRRNKRSNY